MNMKKIIAGVSAVVLMSATSISAFAAEKLTKEEIAEIYAQTFYMNSAWNWNSPEEATSFEEDGTLSLEWDITGADGTLGSMGVQIGGFTTEDAVYTLTVSKAVYSLDGNDYELSKFVGTSDITVASTEYSAGKIQYQIEVKPEDVPEVTNFSGGKLSFDLKFDIEGGTDESSDDSKDSSSDSSKDSSSDKDSSSKADTDSKTPTSSTNTTGGNAETGVGASLALAVAAVAVGTAVVMKKKK